MKTLQIITLLTFISIITFGQKIHSINSKTYNLYVDSVVNKYALEYMNNKGTVGFSIGIIYKNKDFNYNYGTAYIADPGMPTENSIYSIGSIAKTFAGTLLSKAVSEKKVALNNDIREYLSDRSKFDNLDYNGKPIRLIDLCNHTSGIPSQIAKLPANWNALSPDEKYLFKKTYTKNEFLKDLSAIKLDTLPGLKYSYSNAAVKLLTILLENIYQTTYEKLLKEEFTKTYGMANTKALLSIDDWQNFAFGEQSKEMLIRTKDIDDYTSGPGLNSTVEDMLKYLKINISENSKIIRRTHKKTFSNRDNI